MRQRLLRAIFHRRNNERLYEANVTSVRALLGTPEQRCWVEREEVAQERRSVNVPGAIAGAIIGGILGHQVGGGRGQDIATAGGAVAGAAVGANVGRGGSEQPVQTRDVQRCESAPSQANPDYWDVTYNFRGQAHRMQMTAPPGPTVTVNEQGEPGHNALTQQTAHGGSLGPYCIDPTSHAGYVHQLGNNRLCAPAYRIDGRVHVVLSQAV